MKKYIPLLSLFLLVSSLGKAQQNNVPPRQHPNLQEQYKKMFEAEAKEAPSFYAKADTAVYGIRYRWTYLYDKAHQRVYKEDRVVWVNPKVTLDMSYQPIGERMQVLTNSARDTSLAYHLTPSFYFYYPKNKQLKKTYRVISEDFLLKDTTLNNKWQITSEEKTIGSYRCKKATCVINGRNWTAWFTKQLPYKAAPRTLTGLPGVVLEAYDSKGEVKWSFTSRVNCDSTWRQYIKFPDRFSAIPRNKFPLVVELFATSPTMIQESGVFNKSKKALPEKLYPHTGIDACVITNPIEL